MKLDFANNDRSHTIGVELEFQVLDKSTLDLTPRADEILKNALMNELTKELFQSTIELVTPICNDVHGIAKFYNSALPALHAQGEELGLFFSGTGTHPRADYRERLITPLPRYLSMVSKNPWLVRRMAVYGMHVHVGMKSGEDCIQYNNFFIRLIPHLISLSASSPFWQGMNTELAACRPTVYETLPTAGIPYPLKNWSHFQNLVAQLFEIGSISGHKDLWWDVRPSPLFGTVEIRVCDGPASLSEMLAISAFIHTAAHWFEDNRNDLECTEPPDQWIIRENKWNAMRRGLDATILVWNGGETRTIRDDIELWINKLEPYYHKFHYQEYLKGLYSILKLGNSSQRQKRVYLDTKSLQEVIKLNVSEFYIGKPMMQS